MNVLDKNEAILYQGKVKYQREKVRLNLTSERMVFDKVVGIFHNNIKVIDEIPLNNIIVYKNKVQIKQKRSKLKIQTTNGKIVLICNSFTDANKIKEEIIKTITGLNVMERASINIKNKAIKGVEYAAVGTVATGAAVMIGKHSKTIVKNTKLIFKGIKKSGKVLKELGKTTISFFRRK